MLIDGSIGPSHVPEMEDCVQVGVTVVLTAVTPAHTGVRLLAADIHG